MIEEILEAREKTHGSYKQHAEITQQLKRVMQHYEKWYDLTDAQREALEMIAHKIGRILAGDPDVKDHWDDIAGYARLVSKMLDNKVGFVKANGKTNPSLNGHAQKEFVFRDMQPTAYLP